MYDVLVRDPMGNKKQLRVSAREVVIGRREPADIILNDRSVSSLHAKLSWHRGRTYIEDLQSSNGVFVLGEKVDGKAEVTPNDVVTIGAYKLWVRALLRYEPREKTEPPPPRRGRGERASPALEAPSEDAPAPAEAPADSPGAPADAQGPAAAHAEAPAADLEAESYAQQLADFYSYITMFLAPVRAYLEDPEVQEILVNGATQVFIERRGLLEETPARFESEDQVRAAAMNIARYVGRCFGEDEPILDARLPDGSRVHAVSPPVSRRGTVLAIRKFQAAELGVERLVELGSISEAALRLLDVAVKTRKNILIAGGTGSGKTSLLNALGALIPDAERIVVLEDSSELQLRQRHVLPLEARPADRHGAGAVTMRDLLKSSLRLRPDRIVFGEVRGGEALDLLQAFNTGHSGSLATIHANSPQETLYRLETLTLYSGLQLPLRAIQDQIASAIDLVVQTGRFHDGSRRVVQVTEVLGLDEQARYRLADLFVFDRKASRRPGVVEGDLRPTGVSPSFLREARLQGYDLPDELFR
ncbi:MAG: Flp pilus assembly complex ATPase component TadA [Planctomycetes bacterium]|nr:Flp pilus assembly complex ATPase component TadA [Planctomycetota bacterium]